MIIKDDIKIKYLTINGLKLISEVTGQGIFGKSTRHAMVYVPRTNTVYTNVSKMRSVDEVEVDDITQQTLCIKSRVEK